MSRRVDADSRTAVAEGIRSKPESAEIGARWLIWLPVVTLILSVGAIAWLSWMVLSLHDFRSQAWRNLLRLEELRGAISKLDEALTMSAWMASVTGDLQWEERYRQFEPEFNRSIQDIYKFSETVDNPALAQLQGANFKLISMQNQALGYARSGRTNEAAATLGSGEYRSQKSAYAKAVFEFVTDAQGRFQARIQSETRRLVWWFSFPIAMLGAAVCSWIWIVQKLQQWRMVLADTLAKQDSIHRELRESQSFYASLVEALPQSVLRKDAHGHFTFGNKKFCGMLRKPLHEIIGRTDFDFFPAELAEKYRRDDQNVISSGKTFETIEEHSTPEGKRLYVNVVKTPIYDAGWRVIGIQAIFWDVTERKLAEENLAQKAKELARSNAELEQFAYVASHDLQEPLRMVASYTQLLARRYSEKLDADAHEFIRFAVDGANRMQQLITDLLSYSRVGTRGKEFSRVDCSTVLGQAVANLQDRIESTGAIITNDDLPIVSGDGTQLIQLFQNLLSNALKFHGEESPRIHIAAREMENLDTREKEWLFFVRDNGIGLDPQYAERIFIIFQRLHSHAEYPGTGIGLAICKKIVERYGGRIWVESQPNQGATFYFTLSSNLNLSTMGPAK